MDIESLNSLLRCADLNRLFNRRLATSWECPILHRTTLSFVGQFACIFRGSIIVGQFSWVNFRGLFFVGQFSWVNFRRSFFVGQFSWVIFRGTQVSPTNILQVWNEVVVSSDWAMKRLIKDWSLIYSVIADVFNPYCSLSWYVLSNELLKYFDFPSSNQEWSICQPVNAVKLMGKCS